MRLLIVKYLNIAVLFAFDVVSLAFPGKNGNFNGAVDRLVDYIITYLGSQEQGISP